jgi:hypothetical protein
MAMKIMLMIVSALLGNGVVSELTLRNNGDPARILAFSLRKPSWETFPRLTLAAELTEPTALETALEEDASALEASEELEAAVLIEEISVDKTTKKIMTNAIPIKAIRAKGLNFGVYSFLLMLMGFIWKHLLP